MDKGNTPGISGIPDRIPGTTNMPIEKDVKPSKLHAAVEFAEGVVKETFGVAIGDRDLKEVGHIQKEAAQREFELAKKPYTQYDQRGETEVIRGQEKRDIAEVNDDHKLKMKGMQEVASGNLKHEIARQYAGQLSEEDASQAMGLPPRR